MLFIAKTKIAYFPYEYIDFGPSGIEWHKVARFGTVTILLSRYKIGRLI